MPESATPAVEHDADRHRFVARLPEGEAALVYSERDGDRLDLLHTEVPPAARGGGVGAALVRAALAHARSHGQQVIPSCPFVRRWLDAHPDEADVVAA